MKIHNIKLVFLISSVTVFSVIIYLASTLDIHPDEAYYFSWSEYLRSGYLDHPPAIAYIIKLSRVLFEGNFEIRGINIILAFILLALVGKSIRLIWNNDNSIYTGLLIVILSPIFLTGTIITTPDTPLIFFISTYIYFTLKTIQSDKYLFSIFSGIFLGLSMLSKYTAFFIIPSLLLFSLRFRKNFAIIKKIALIPILVSILVYSPNIVYNVNTGYKSYLFQITHGILHPKLEPIKTFIPYFLSQLFIFSPFVFVVFLINLNRYRKESDIQRYLLFAWTIIPLGLFMILALFKHVEANWSAFGFLPLLILTICEVIKSVKRLLLILSYHVLVFLIILLHINFSILPLSADNDPLTQVKYWKKTYNMIRENIPENKTLVTFRYQISSILYYYSRGKITSLCFDRRFVNSEIGTKDAHNWVMIDFFPAKTATEIALNICNNSIVRIPLVISENMNIIRRIDVIYCDNKEINN